MPKIEIAKGRKSYVNISCFLCEFETATVSFKREKIMYHHSNHQFLKSFLSFIFTNLLYEKQLETS